VSLHPRLARTLVNLTQLQTGETVLDTFCGTGGILLEAGLIGLDIIGADIDLRMVQGTKTNLTHWGLKNFKLIEANITELPDKLGPLHPQAIVTEPPYGRASTTGGEELDELMEKSFSVFSSVLPPNGRVVISLPDTKLVEHAKNKFELLDRFEVRVHKSLTKSIFLLRNLGQMD